MSKDKQEKFTKFESARVIGARATQLESGAPLLLKMTKNQLEEIEYRPIEIAKKEMEEGVIPITVVRD